MARTGMFAVRLGARRGGDEYGCVADEFVEKRRANTAGSQGEMLS